MPRTLILGIALLLGVTTISAAQPNTLEPIRQLAPGVYAVLQRLPWRVSDSNVLVIINDEDVVVVDANIYPSSARHIIAEIRKLTPKPVRYVVNTHWHSDHHYGNAAYREAYPGVEFIQHAKTRREVIERDVPALAKNLETEYPAAIASLRKALQTGKTSTGDSVTSQMRTSFTELLGVYELFMSDMKNTPIVPGTMTVTDSLVLRRGERSIVVKHLGRGNTEGDLIVHLPRERIVATGDLVVLPIPFAFFSYLKEWPGTLRALAQLDAVTIMPGHGPIQTDWSYVNRLATLIESTWQQVERAVSSGANLEAVQKQVNLDSLRHVFAGTNAGQRRAFDDFFMKPGIESAFRQLRPDSTVKP